LVKKVRDAMRLKEESAKKKRGRKDNEDEKEKATTLP